MRFYWRSFKGTNTFYVTHVDEGESCKNSLSEPRMPKPGKAHQLINRTDEVVTYIEVGDRTPGEQVTYPRDDIIAQSAPDGSWITKHKDGTPY